MAFATNTYAQRSITFTALSGTATPYLVKSTNTYVLFGFSMTVSGLVTGSNNYVQVGDILINSGLSNQNNYLTNGKIIQTTNPAGITSGTTGVGSLNTSGTNQYKLNGIFNNNQITANGTYTFYLVFDVTNLQNGFPSPTNFTFSLPSPPVNTSNTFFFENNVKPAFTTPTTTSPANSNPTFYFASATRTWYGNTNAGPAGGNTASGIYNWSNPGNWVENAVPTSTDVAIISVQRYVNPPTITSTGSVGAIQMGTLGGDPTSIIVNAAFTVNNDITYQSDNQSFRNLTATISGTNALTVKNLNVIANTTISAFPYTLTIASTVNTLNITGSINLTSELNTATHSSIFNITGGTTVLTGTINTINTAGGTSTVSVTNATLKLANAAALSGLSALGTNVIDVDNTGTTIEYSGSTQVVYTDANITGLTGGVSYQNIKFSGSGVKTPNGGNLNVGGDFTNNAGSSSNLVLSTTPVIFNGSSVQALSNASGTTTLFKNVTFQGGGSKTMSGSGNFNVSSTGTVTMAANTSLAAGGVLTLKSDASGTGRVGTIPATAQITGNVTVERWFTGGQAANRGWRLMSSPVNNATGTYNFSSLQTNLYITGATGGGFDVSPANNATVLLYDTPNKKLISLPSITSGVTVGSGFYFYFRGNKTSTTGKLVKTGSPAAYATPEANVVGLQTGAINQQGVNYTLSNAGSGFNLVGNPYASTITMPSGGGSVGSSAPFTGTTGFVYTYTSGANSIIAEPTSVNIASGQGFYVKTVSTGSGPYKVAFTESLKSTAQITTGLLLGKPVGSEQPILSIKMVQDSANYDIAHLRFLDTYKNEYDEMEDADDYTGSGQNTFLGVMTSDNHQVAIASQPLDKKRTSVFLNVNDNFSGLYTIQKMNLSGIPNVYDVWLMDHFKNDSLDFRANDIYKFNLDKANPLTFGAARFEIVIRKKALPPYELVSFNGQRTGTDVLLKWNTVNEFDYTSFELQRSTDGTNFEAVRNMQSSSQGSYNFKDIYSSNNTATIYYRLKQVDINDVVYYSNVIIITPAKGNGTFAVFPNPATNTIQFSLDQTLKSPSVRLSIFNTMGLLMKSSTFTASSGQQDVSTLIPGNYTIEITDLGTKKPILTGKFIKL